MVELESGLGKELHPTRSISPPSLPKSPCPEGTTLDLSPSPVAPSGPDTPNKYPTGEQMIARQHKVYDVMESMLRKGSPVEYPPARGWHFIAQLEFWAEQQPECAEAIAYFLLHRARKHDKWTFKRSGRMPGWVFKKLTMTVEPESIRRRIQELQAPEREAVDKGIIRVEDAIYLPSERVLQKRKLLEIMMKYEYSNFRRSPYQKALEEYFE